MSREDELREALGVRKSATRTARPVADDMQADDTQKVSSLKRGKVVGRGVLKTRLNWGLIVLIAAFVLFLITQFVIRPMVGG